MGAAVSIDIESPKRWPESTERKPYQPMPGDIVSVDCKGIDPKYDQHGTRIGVFERMTYAHGEEGACVRLPGWTFTLCVAPESLTLIRRPTAGESREESKR